MTSNATSTLAIRIHKRAGVIRFEGITGCDAHGGAGPLQDRSGSPGSRRADSLLQPLCPFAEEVMSVRSGQIRCISRHTSAIDTVTLWWTDGRTLHLDADLANPEPTRTSRSTHTLLAMSRVEVEALRGAIAMWHEGVRPMANAGLAAAAGVTAAEMRYQPVTRAQLTALAHLRGHHATQRDRHSFYVQ